MSINEANFYMFRYIHQDIPLENVLLAELGNQHYKHTDHAGKEVDRGSAKRSIRNVWREHTSFDINGKDDSIIMDLSNNIEEKWYGKFNVVTNFGTTEHIENQPIVFLNIHNMCSINGLMLHSVPLNGYWKLHSPWKYTENFVYELAESNKYNIKLCEIKPRRKDKLLNFILQKTHNSFCWSSATQQSIVFDERYQRNQDNLF